MLRSRAPSLFLCPSLTFVCLFVCLSSSSIYRYVPKLCHVLDLETPQPRNQEVDCLLFSLRRYDPYPKEPLTFMRYKYIFEAVPEHDVGGGCTAAIEGASAAIRPAGPGWVSCVGLFGHPWENRLS